MSMTERELLGESIGYADRVRAAVLAAGESRSFEGLATAMLGDEPVRPAGIREEATWGTLYGRRVIFTADWLSPRRARWCAAHLFASWLLARDGVAYPEVRRFRAAVAAELLLPAEVCRVVLPAPCSETLADALRVPLSVPLLREAAVFRLPTALVVPGVHARVLGDDNGRLPPTLAELELLASRRGIGVRRWNVPEDRGTVIRVAA